MSELIKILLQISDQIGYWGIILLMAIESSFVPFPSEIIIPPAAYLAQQGQMNILFVIISGIFGSLVGATINYLLAMSLGRKVIYSLAKTKLAHILLIDQAKIEKAEKYFLNYGNLSTFLGRLIPAIRQLISIPAGFSRMEFSKFVFFTSLGSGLWVIVLAFLGYLAGENTELLEKYYKEISITTVFIVLAIIIYIIIKKIKSRRDKINP